VVVGHKPLGVDAVASKERECSTGKRGDRRRALVWVQLGVGQAAVVVDDRVGELPTWAVAFLGEGSKPVAGQSVPGADKARELLDVHVQQIARAGPLVADDLAAVGRRTA
jgi:hypothetical protein